jgi:peptide/nickel transport system permease protein
VTLVLGGAITGLLAVTAGLSQIYTPQDPLAMSIAARLDGPSWRHPFGTDQYGRDILSRVMGGAQTSIAVGVIAVGIGAGFGMVVGIAQRLHRRVDRRGLHAAGRRRARVSRHPVGTPLRRRVRPRGGGEHGRHRDCLRARLRAPDPRRLSGAARTRLRGGRSRVGRERRPAHRPAHSSEHASTLIIQATTAFPVAILAEAGLAYLGLGTQPPHPSWGLMLKEARNFLSLSPSYAVFPGGAIAVTVLGLNLLGDGLRDLLDPKMA